MKNYPRPKNFYSLWNQTIKFLVLPLLVLAFNSCNKSQSEPESFRLIKSVFTDNTGHFSNDVKNITYQGDHLQGSVSSIFKI